MPKTACRAKMATRSKTTDRARVVLDFSGSKATIEDSDNVSAVDDVDDKYLVVHFVRPFRDELYRCDVIPSEPVDYKIKARSREGVGIRLATPRPKRIKIVCEEL